MSDSPIRGEFKFGHGGARAGAGRKPNPPDPKVPAIERWYCVHTCNGDERVADVEIRRAGFSLFAPFMWKAATPARRGVRGTLHPAKPERLVPLFPRYLFVRFSLASYDWVQILKLPGVDYIIGATLETPRPVADEAIELIRSLCAPNGCIYPNDRKVASDSPAPLAPGTSVKVLSGVFSGLAGICGRSDTRRVQVLLEIMGRPSTVELPRARVEAG